MDPNLHAAKLQNPLGNWILPETRDENVGGRRTGVNPIRGTGRRVEERVQKKVHEKKANETHSIRQLQKKGKVSISAPANPVHIDHVSVDSYTGEYKGLPKAWERLLGIARGPRRKLHSDEPESIDELEPERITVAREVGGLHDNAIERKTPYRDGELFRPAPQAPISKRITLEREEEVRQKKTLPPPPAVDISSGALVGRSPWTSIQNDPHIAELAASPVEQNSQRRSGIVSSSMNGEASSKLATAFGSLPPLVTSEQLKTETDATAVSPFPSEHSISTSSSQALSSTASVSVEWLPSTYGLAPGHRDYKEINAHLLHIVDSLGHGSLGVVEEVRVSPGLPSFVRKRVLIPFNRRKQYLKIIKEEARVLQDITHCHVVKMLGTYAEMPDNRNGRQFYSLLMAPVGERDLKTFLDIVADGSITQTRDWIKDAQIKDAQIKDAQIKDARISLFNWFKCLSSALAYLHGQGIRHQDIKPSNIIHRGSEIYFTDFSSASQFQIGQTTSTENPARTSAMYAAPEVIADDGTLNRHGRGTDVFALGAVFTEMRAVLLGSSIEKYHSTLAKSLPNGPDETLSSSPTPRENFLYGRKLEQINAFFTDDPFYNICIAPMLKVDRESRPDAQSVAWKIREYGAWAFRGCLCDVEYSSKVVHETRSDMIGPWGPSMRPKLPGQWGSYVTTAATQHEQEKEPWEAPRKKARRSIIAFPMPLDDEDFGDSVYDNRDRLHDEYFDASEFPNLDGLDVEDFPDDVYADLNRLDGEDFDLVARYMAMGITSGTSL